MAKDTNMLQFLLPNYHEPIQQCGRKGGLITNIHKSFSNPTKVDNIYKSSDWEALIVDVQDDRFARKITIVNYYRPPRDSYSNASIDKFLTPLEVIQKS